MTNLDLNVILPVYNERETIESVLIEWEKELKKIGIKYKFIVCEDGSNDGTSKFLRSIKKKYQLILDQKLYRRGYGGAVIDGIMKADSKYILSIDSDGQCDPKDFKKFWKHKNMSDIIIGYRIKRADPLKRIIFSNLFGLVFRTLFPSNEKIIDPSCPYLLYKKETVLPLINYFKYLKEGFWWGFIGASFKHNLSIYQIPVKHRERAFGETVVYQNNKIVSIAIRNLIGIFKLKFSS